MDDTATLELSLYPRWNDSCVWKPTDDGVIIVKIQKSEQGPYSFQALKLNTEGKDTWMHCTGENTISDIIEILQAGYEGGRQDIQRDVVGMIMTLGKEGYLFLEQSSHRIEQPLNEKAYPRRNDDVIANVIEDKFVIMDMKTSEVYSLEKEIECLWDMCDGTRTVEDIISAAPNHVEAAFSLQLLAKVGLLELLTRMHEPQGET